MELRRACISVLFVYFIQLVNFISSECPGDADKYIRRGNKFCQKIYNCEKGHEILECVNNCSKERCRPCPSGKVQPFLIHSETPDDDRSCFVPKGNCDEKRGTVPIRNGKSDRGCPSEQYCQCNLYDCWWGSNPCLCDVKAKCEAGHYLFYDGREAKCVPCPWGSYKNSVGCQPCFLTDPHNTSDTTTRAPSTRAGTTLTPTTLVTTISTAETTKSDQTDTTSAGDITTSNPSNITSSVDTDSPAGADKILVIVLPVVSGLAVVVVIFIFILIWKRRQQKTFQVREENGNTATETERLTEREETCSRHTGNGSNNRLIIPDNQLDPDRFNYNSSLSDAEPKSPISETSEPPKYHPQDPRALQIPDMIVADNSNEGIENSDDENQEATGSSFLNGSLLDMEQTQKKVVQEAGNTFTDMKNDVNRPLLTEKGSENVLDISDEDTLHTDKGFVSCGDFYQPDETPEKVVDKVEMNGSLLDKEQTRKKVVQEAENTFIDTKNEVNRPLLTDNGSENILDISEEDNLHSGKGFVSCGVFYQPDETREKVLDKVEINGKDILSEYNSLSKNIFETDKTNPKSLSSCTTSTDDQSETETKWVLQD